MGLGCFFWVPLSIGIGRRPTLLIATMVTLLALVWAAEASSFRQLVCAVCLLGLGEGLGLSLVSRVPIHTNRNIH
jgi:predicted MFS family arabinose efflux permease